MIKKLKTSANPEMKHQNLSLYWNYRLVGADKIWLIQHVHNLSSICTVAENYMLLLRNTSIPTERNESDVIAQPLFPLIDNEIIWSVSFPKMI